MAPLVSIVTPVLNAEAYLAEAIDSVLAQTWPNWELLLVDDGSTDQSVSIAQDYRARHQGRIRLLASADRGRRGAAAARNIGIDAAQGEYVAFLDADDVFSPRKLEVQAGILEAHQGVGMVYGPTKWWFPADPRRNWVERPGMATERIYQPPALLVRVILGHGPDIPCTCGVMVRREASLAVGGFEETFRLYEDQSLWAKLFLREQVFVSSQCLARYRQHPASSSAIATGQGDYDHFAAHEPQRAFFTWLEEYARNTPYRDVLRPAFRLALLPYSLSSPANVLELFARRVARRGFERYRRLTHRLRGPADEF